MEEKTSAIKFIKELKRKTRKRYNSEEKIAVVLAVRLHTKVEYFQVNLVNSFYIS